MSTYLSGTVRRCKETAKSTEALAFRMNLFIFLCQQNIRTNSQRSEHLTSKANKLLSFRLIPIAIDLLKLTQIFALPFGAAVVITLRMSGGSDTCSSVTYQYWHILYRFGTRNIPTHSKSGSNCL
jgi:hypothetical protein